MAHAHLIIVGAGWFGLTMAKTYKQLRPDAHILILESAESVGGVWASSRLYPGLKTNNLWGSYENPDFPMTIEEFGVKQREHIPGTAVSNYLSRFAEHFGIERLVLYKHSVQKVEEQTHGGPGDWKLVVQRPSKTFGALEEVQFTAEKLVIAAGVTANPNLPIFAGAGSFEAPIFHAKEFKQHEDLLHKAKRVVVYGGAKSAWDGVYAYAASGVEVNWVMRESGRGPCWMAPAFVKDVSWLENTAFTRLFTLFQPCMWKQKDGFDWLRWLLHCTFLGRVLVSWFWSSFEKQVIHLNGYENHPETEKLRPWSSAFWAGTTLSILNYPTDFFELVRSSKIKIYHADIVALDDDRTVILSDGTRLSEIDALHCSTGWKHEPPITFSPPSLSQKLRMAGETTSEAEVSETKAATEVLKRFPVLRQQPNVTPKRRNRNEMTKPQPRSVPYHLYRFSVPPAFWEKRNISIIGTFLSLGQAVSAQVQSLWVSAYLTGSLPSQTGFTMPLKIKDIDWETELQNQFQRLRFPGGCGDKHGEITFETVPFYDLLLRDLGLETRRKSSFWKEWIEPYKPLDYKGLVDEWAAKTR